MMDQVGLDVVDIEEHYCAEHPEYPEDLESCCGAISNKAGWESESRCGLLRRLPASG